MRIPKFRAWDSVNKKMIAITSDGNSGNLLKMESDGKWEIWKTFDILESALDNKKDYWLVCSTNGGLLLQFTGLHDRNGEEIYEGDILKLQYPINYGFAGTHNKEIIVKISYDAGCFWFEGDGYTDCNWHFYNEYEVIGNIYENPELLEAE